MRINKIISFSCIDGPGNRMVIFFQGCNFKCSYCHNPETINLCSNCGDCLSACQAGALSLRNGEIFWDELLCKQCDQCINVCSQLSSPKTKPFTVESLMAQIRRIEPFIEGITVSGGECTLNIPFLVDLFKKIKTQTKLTCFVDTNAGLDLTNHDELISLVDGFMLDVKVIDPKEHYQLTGMSNQNVQKNLSLLLNQNKLYEVRTVVAPSLDNEKTIKWVASQIKDCCFYKLLTYRPFGVRREGLKTLGTACTSNEYMKYLVERAKEWGATYTSAV